MQLKEYRQSIGMSRAEMARQLSVDITTAWRWEAGFTLPGAETMRAIQRWSGGRVRPNDWIRDDVRSGGEA